MMKIIKTYEELFWKSSTDPIESNKSKLKGLPSKIMDYLDSSIIVGLLISKVEVGFSKTHRNRFLVDLIDSRSDSKIRFSFRMNPDTFQIQYPEIFTITKNDTPFFNSIRQGHNKAFYSENLELTSLQEYMMKYFKQK